MIAIEQLAKHYAAGGVCALAEVDLQVKAGEIFGVIGKSGAGKSTLIRCINLLERPSSGRVVVAGRDLTALDNGELRAARRDIGMVFQHFNLLSSRTVYENVALPLELAGIERSAITARVEPLLDMVGLVNERDRYPAQLSGGQKQRVGIARALANQPKVLLCDEATSALDPETTRAILALLRDINHRLGLTIVVITHEMLVIKDLCDRVAVLDGGRIVEQGEVFDVFTQPRHDATRALVSDIVGQEIPAGLLERLTQPHLSAGGTLLRLALAGGNIDIPLLSTLTRRFNIDLNLLHGQIDEIQGRPFGSLLVLAEGDPAQLEAALGWLRTLDICVEVVDVR